MTIDAALREAASGPWPIALVTVALVSGSAPRHSGSRMAVRPDGAITGTVGGGALEARAREEALACLAQGRSGKVRVDMTGEKATGTELICGGVSELWIELVAEPSPYAAVAAAVDRGEEVVVVASADSGCLAVVGPGGDRIAGDARAVAVALDPNALTKARESGHCAIGENDGFLYSPLESSERLLILGGGHVSLALARVAVGLSFSVTVADPRPEYSSPERFPKGILCRTSGFSEAIESFRFGTSAYVVVVSPGHLGDLECARAILRKEYRYAGLIGSRRKSRMLIEQLLAEGFPRDKTEALRAPIGLDIGAETPEEIAIAIAAELLAVRHTAASLDWIDGDRKRRRET
jgi:xanthine dehydrogenase accessory factor